MKRIRTTLVALAFMVLGTFSWSTTARAADEQKPALAGGSSIFYDQYLYCSALGYTGGDWDARCGGFLAGDLFGDKKGTKSGNYFDAALEGVAAAGSGDSQAAELLGLARYSFKLLDEAWAKLLIGGGAEIAHDSWKDETVGRPVIEVALQAYGLDPVMQQDGTTKGGNLPVFVGIKFRDIPDDRLQVAVEGGTSGMKLHVYAGVENIWWNDGNRDYLSAEGQVGDHVNSTTLLFLGVLYRDYTEDSEKFAGDIPRVGPEAGVQLKFTVGGCELQVQAKGGYLFRSDSWVDPSTRDTLHANNDEGFGQIVLVLIP